MSKSSTEREHKYLVRSIPTKLSTYPHHLIRQGYLAIGDDGRQARLRAIRRGNHRPRYILTFKAGKTAARLEEEIAIPERDFARLWPLTRGWRLEKVRYEIPIDRGLTVELDVYRGRHRGLVVAEVEFSSARQAKSFRPPNWLGKQVDRNKRYANTRLARFPLAKE